MPHKLKGITLEQLHGKRKAEVIREKYRKAHVGKFFHKDSCRCFLCKMKKGKVRGAAHPQWGRRGSQSPAYGIRGKQHNGWKGDEAKYVSIHEHIRRRYGKANHCDSPECFGICKKFQWSNKDHKYKRNIEDWQQLCISCHKLYDVRFRK